MVRTHPFASLTTKNPSLPKVKRLFEEVLAKASSEPRFRSARERDALIAAIQFGHIEIAKQLILLGVTSDMPDQKRRTPLWHACREGRGSIIQELIESGAKLPDDALLGPVIKGDLKTVRYLIKHGANVNCVAGLVTHMIPEKYSPLTAALRRAMIGRLVQRTSSSTTSSKRQSDHDLESIPIFLIKLGARLDQFAGYRTVLGLAAHCGLANTVKAMVEAGADVNIKDTLGGTALIDAAQEGHKQIVMMLLSAGAKTNVKRKDGFTAVSIAREHGFNELADEIERHARP
jgi:ankyrin repeat protein